jgi:hypothetical protein
MRVVEAVIAAVLASACAPHTQYAASALSDPNPNPMGVCNVIEQCSEGGGGSNLELAIVVGSAVVGVLTLALVRHIALDFRPPQRSVTAAPKGN